MFKYQGAASRALSAEIEKQAKEYLKSGGSIKKFGAESKEFKLAFNDPRRRGAK